MSQRHCLALVLTAGLGACGGSVAAPTIGQLTYAPDHVVAGTLTTVSGTLAFSGALGAVRRLDTSVTLPGGQTQALPATDLAHAGDQTSGTVAFAIALTPPVAGRYDFALWVSGDDGESNRLSGTLGAE